MTTDTVSRFESSLSGVGVGLTRTTTGDLASTLEAEIDPPAVGTPLGIEGVSLEDAGVNTDPTTRELGAAETGVTPAGKGIAQHGTLVIQSDGAGSEPMALYPPNHVAVLRESDVVGDVGEALSWLGEEFDAGRDSAVFATGVSATADMGELVFGVHGPVAVHVVLVTDR